MPTQPYDHKNKGGSCTDPQCWCRGYENVPLSERTALGQMDAYRNETPQERAARELAQAEGMRNAYSRPVYDEYYEYEQRQKWDSPFKRAYRERKVENKWPLAIAWTAILVIIVLGVLGLILP